MKFEESKGLRNLILNESFSPVTKLFMLFQDILENTDDLSYEDKEREMKKFLHQYDVNDNVNLATDIVNILKRIRKK